MSLKRMARGALERVETAFDVAFTPSLNPLYRLGALGWFLYWTVAVTGIYLYAFFDTGIEDAYDSVHRITHLQWYAGGIMRSLHRYASDALVLVVLLHLLREYLLDRMRGLVEGVLLTGCREGDCHFRRGMDWTEQRIHARRDPYLRRRVPRERVACAWLGTDGERRLREEIERFRARLSETEARRRPAAATLDGEGARASAGGGRSGG